MDNTMKDTTAHKVYTDKYFGIECTRTSRQFSARRLEQILWHFGPVYNDAYRRRRRKNKIELLQELKTLEINIAADHYVQVKRFLSYQDGHNIPEVMQPRRVVIPRRDCVVCMESLPVADFPDRKITTQCQEVATICKACLASSITAQLDFKSWNQISCPLCLNLLESEDVKKFATEECVQR